MTSESHSQERMRRTVLLVLTLGISLLFLAMIRSFLMALLLAAIFAGLVHPLHAVLMRWFKGRKTWASLSTLIVVMLVVGLPLLAFLGLVATQAVQVSQTAGPWIEEQISHVGTLDEHLRHVPLLDHIPGVQHVLPSSEQVVAKAGEAASAVGSFLVHNLAVFTRGTVGFFLQLFIMLYAMFFFLSDGDAILHRILFYIPLAPEDEERLLDKFVSVAKATLKGSLLMAIIQGVMAGLAYWVVGVSGWAFWGTVTIVAAIVPAVGGAIVWVPMAAYLLLVGRGGAALAVVLWCGLVVGTIDNFLRPVLVGRDTRMSDLLILLSTLGGIFLFGPVGFVVGPIVAALFVTIWHIYGEAFGEWLPGRAPEEG